MFTLCLVYWIVYLKWRFEKLIVCSAHRIAPKTVLSSGGTWTHSTALRLWWAIAVRWGASFSAFSPSPFVEFLPFYIFHTCMTRAGPDIVHNKTPTIRQPPLNLPRMERKKLPFNRKKVAAESYSSLLPRLRFCKRELLQQPLTKCDALQNVQENASWWRWKQQTWGKNTPSSTTRLWRRRC